MLSQAFRSAAVTGARTVLVDALRLSPLHRVSILYDKECPLTVGLAEAYSEVLPSRTTQVEFTPSTAAECLQQTLSSLAHGDGIVLVQSNAFQYHLKEYRLRLRLFEKGLKVVEHAHLDSIPHTHYETYAKALHFSPSAHRNEAERIKSALAKAQKIVIRTGGRHKEDGVLTYSGPMEPALFNIGDYEGMTTVGGAFPVGEVISESVSLEDVSGVAYVWAYPSQQKVIEEVAGASSSFPVRIEKGVVVGDYTDPAVYPSSFGRVVDMVRQAEGEALIREFGVGLNGAMGKGKMMAEPTAFERQRGLHISMGKKHNLFRKPNLRKRDGKLHIDLYLDLTEIAVWEPMSATPIVLHDGKDFTIT